MKKILVSLLFFSIVGSVIAQDAVIVPNKKHEFGFQAGFTTGVGLSYRYWPGKLGLQITALPVKSDDITFVSLGVTGLYSIYNSRLTRFFMYLGSSYTVNNYYNETYYESDLGIWEYRKDFVENKELNVGIGPGFGFGSRVRFNIMAGYGFYDITGKFNILPTVEGGLYFRF